MEEFTRAGECIGHYSKTDQVCRKCLIASECRLKTDMKVKEVVKKPIENLIDKCKDYFEFLDKKRGKKNKQKYLYRFKVKENNMIGIAFDSKTKAIDLNINGVVTSYGILSDNNLDQIFEEITKIKG